MKIVKLPRSKKIVIAAAIVFAVAVAMAVYLVKPLPPPNVLIEFQGYKLEKTKNFHLVAATNDNNQIFYQSDSRTDWWFRAFPSFENFSADQTNAFCVLYLTNQGPTRVWWISMDCQVEAKTQNGWVTNVFSHFTTVPWSVGSSRKDIFDVYVPVDAIEWRIAGQYEYYKRHNACLEFMGWLVDDLKLSRERTPRIVIYSSVPIFWTLSVFPEQKREFIKFQSKFFTNKPPADFSFTNLTTL